jgi:hypothetical protein
MGMPEASGSRKFVESEPISRDFGPSPFKSSFSRRQSKLRQARRIRTGGEDQMKKGTAYYVWATILSLPLTLYVFQGDWDIAIVVSVLIGVLVWIVYKVVQAATH